MATAGPDIIAQCVDQAVAFLAQSDREFDAGDRRQGSEKLYGAATQAVIRRRPAAWLAIPEPPRHQKRGHPPGIGSIRTR